jgi:hypothetical protein
MSSLQALWYQHPLSVAEELLKQLGESRKKKDIRYVVRSLLEITNVLNSGSSRQVIQAFVEYLHQNFVLACLLRKKSKDLRRTVLLRLNWYRQEPALSRNIHFMDQLFYIEAALV